MGWVYSCKTVTLKVFVDWTIGYNCEYAWMVNVKTVSVFCFNNISVGWAATLPVISPLSNNTKLGGNSPSVTLYDSDVSDVATTFKVLIVVLNIVPKLAGDSHIIVSVISLLKL